MPKKLKILFIAIISLIYVGIILFLPTFNLKTTKMISKQTDKFIFYYEKQDEKAVLDMAEILEKKYETINSATKFSSTKKQKYMSILI
ncbi:hypothetical protein PL321_01880 [Caloramator sp. mosi_1]|uniref:hypothetical protein n=1 Tax=Caloramator sp. mosi_1 TaxID=3023090 RepID=UPI00235EC1A3|nr:hypothetical protein [Caloramator sp. mosi_1]WDC84526.1 hypothetical protein PL321_01880 [Caloramator sp. mosi_1]